MNEPTNNSSVSASEVRTYAPDALTFSRPDERAEILANAILHLTQERDRMTRNYTTVLLSRAEINALVAVLTK